jgi:hypothetical protein
MEEPRVNTHTNWLMMSLIASLGFIGCQGAGQTVNFDLHASPASIKTTAAHEEDLTILVEPFRDSRLQSHRIGSRSHFWGGATHFNVWDGNVGEGMANLAVEYLQQKNWQAMRSPASETDAGPRAADVILTGNILALEANAKSGFGFTNIAVRLQVAFEGKNTVDGSTVKMVLGANGSDTVATFNPKDVEQLLNLVAKDLFNQLFRDLTVKNKAFHLKPAST